MKLHSSGCIERGLLHEFTDGLKEAHSAVFGGKQGVQRDFELEQRLLCGLHFHRGCAFRRLSSRRGGCGIVQGNDINYQRCVG